MAQITVTLDLTAETLELLKLLVSAPAEKAESGKDNHEVPAESGKDKKSAKRAAPKNKETPAEEAIPVPATEVTLTDVRAVALKLSKAGKQKELKEIFAKYGADKLSSIAPDNYAALLADLEEKING